VGSGGWWWWWWCSRLRRSVERRQYHHERLAERSPAERRRGQTKTQRRSVRGSGSCTHSPRRHGVFSVDLRKGPASKVTYLDAQQHVRFHTLQLGPIRFGTTSATLQGVGLVNGRRVSFVA